MIKLLKNQKHFFKILPGDLIQHYPFGKLFYADDVKSEAEKFYNKDRVPTGLISGKKVKTAVGLAREYEKDFDEKIEIVNGSRRFFWIFPEDIEGKYLEDEAQDVQKLTTLSQDPSNKVVKLTVSSSGSGVNSYTYRIFNNTTSYVIQNGDHLVFKVYFDKILPMKIKDRKKG